MHGREVLGSEGNRRCYAGGEVNRLGGGGSLARNRFLRGGIGLWTQRDPFDYYDSTNLYEYAKSDPTGGVDPYGLAVVPCPGSAEWEADVSRVYPCSSYLVSTEDCCISAMAAEIVGIEEAYGEYGAPFTCEPYSSGPDISLWGFPCYQRYGWDVTGISCEPVYTPIGRYPNKQARESLAHSFRKRNNGAASLSPVTADVTPKVRSAVRISGTLVVILECWAAPQLDEPKPFWPPVR